MMDKLIVSLFLLQHSVDVKLKARREAGQGIIEYISAMALALIVIAALVLVFGPAGTALGGKVTAIVSKVTGIGGA